jgi:hypothetical protein
VRLAESSGLLIRPLKTIFGSVRKLMCAITAATGRDAETFRSARDVVRLVVIRTVVGILAKHKESDAGERVASDTYRRSSRVSQARAILQSRMTV